MEENKQIRAKTMLVYVGILSIGMLFAAFTSAYFVTMGDGFWVDLTMPHAFYYSTGIIILSSLTLAWAVKSIKNGEQSKFKTGLVLTLFLGLLFAWFQFRGWHELTQTGNYLSGDIGNLKGEYGKDYTISYRGTPLIYDNGNFYMPDDSIKERPLNEELKEQYNAASGYFYILTALHLLHLFGGLLYLLYVVLLALKNKFSAENYLKPKLLGVYWHFLDILWVYLFFFLSFIH